LTGASTPSPTPLAAVPPVAETSPATPSQTPPPTEAATPAATVAETPAPTPLATAALSSPPTPPPAGALQLVHSALLAMLCCKSACVLQNS